MNNNEGKYVMRPASSDEAGLFFALPPEQDEALGGHWPCPHGLWTGRQ